MYTHVENVFVEAIAHLILDTFFHVFGWISSVDENGSLTFSESENEWTLLLMFAHTGCATAYVYLECLRWIDYCFKVLFF